MFYKECHTESLSKELFKNPASEYRGTPFWAWNCKMSRELIDNTLRELKEMGMGGAHFHSRTGLKTPYLGEEFMELVKYGVKRAKQEDMLVWLYDEDRWRSGAGGGYVTRDHQYRNRYLVFAPDRMEDKELSLLNYTSKARAVRSSERTFLKRYAVLLENGYLKDYCVLESDERLPDSYQEWFAYLEVSGDTLCYNNQAYINTLDKKAVERFIETTYQRYYEKVGGEFGQTIPAIFTDEPQFSHKRRAGFAGERKEIIIPFTDDLEETFKETYKNSLLEHLPEIFWESEDGKVSVTRYQYHDHLCERFTRAFADTIGNWCKEHGIMLTGHLMHEPTLYSQTLATGGVMRAYPYFQLPGIDMLCDRRELSTAKQAQSAARQYGKPGVMSELYGVTNWDFDFRGHKIQGDWQVALGVTVRVPHLTWASMAGEAKRDYPASIGYQSPWYKEYKFLETYFARINTALTRGKAISKIGVIHPIETYWLYWGTKEKTAAICQELDERFDNIIKCLLFGLQDFDFIAESLLAEQSPVSDISGREFPVGEMEYDVIIVPNCITLRKSTLERLQKFHQNGGKVIFTGKLPEYLEARPDPELQGFVEECEHVEFSSNSLLEALEDYRLVDVKNGSGIRSKNLIYQLRKDKENCWLFLSHVNRMENPDIPQREDYYIRIKGNWELESYDAFSGEIEEEKAYHEKGETVLRKTLYDHDSLLLFLKPASELRSKKGQKTENNKAIIKKSHLNTICDYHLSEENVLLLDMAEYKLDNNQWQDREEILRIDNHYRKQLGYPLRMAALAQPWLTPEEEPYHHKLFLRFRIFSEYKAAGIKLALENAADTKIFLNVEKIKSKPDGWYVDRSIKTVPLPVLRKGENELLAEIPYNSGTDLEAMYLLGDFGVKVMGNFTKIVEPVEKMTFGDIRDQGLPFYGGNLTYNLELELPEGIAKLQASYFRSPLLKVRLDGEEKGVIAFSPYELSLGEVEAGKHHLEITFFGNRVNTFGTVHNCNHTETWFGPDAWRTKDEEWSYEYCLKATGILKAPQIIVEER